MADEELKNAFLEYFSHTPADSSEDSCSNDSLSSQTSINRKPASLNAASPLASRLFKCEWLRCNFESEIEESLFMHVTHVHVESQRGESYFCRWENCKQFNSPEFSLARLKKHMMLHTGERAHKCMISNCPFSCHSRQLLANHVLAHFESANHGPRKPASANHGARKPASANHGARKPASANQVAGGCNKNSQAMSLANKSGLRTATKISNLLKKKYQNIATNSSTPSSNITNTEQSTSFSRQNSDNSTIPRKPKLKYLPEKRKIGPVFADVDHELIDSLKKHLTSLHESIELDPSGHPGCVKVNGRIAATRVLSGSRHEELLIQYEPEGIFPEQWVSSCEVKELSRIIRLEQVPHKFWESQLPHVLTGIPEEVQHKRKRSL